MAESVGRKGVEAFFEVGEESKNSNQGMIRNHNWKPFIRLKIRANNFLIKLYTCKIVTCKLDLKLYTGLPHSRVQNTGKKTWYSEWVTPTSIGGRLVRLRSFQKEGSELWIRSILLFGTFLGTLGWLGRGFWHFFCWLLTDFSAARANLFSTFWRRLFWSRLFRGRFLFEG